jgi:hypothetical protein
LEQKAEDSCTIQYITTTLWGRQDNIPLYLTVVPWHMLTALPSQGAYRKENKGASMSSQPYPNPILWFCSMRPAGCFATAKGFDENFGPLRALLDIRFPTSLPASSGHCLMLRRADGGRTHISSLCCLPPRPFLSGCCSSKEQREEGLALAPRDDSVKYSSNFHLQQLVSSNSLRRD